MSSVLSARSLGGLGCAWSGESVFAPARRSIALAVRVEEEAAPARAWGRAEGWARAGDWAKEADLARGEVAEEAEEAGTGAGVEEAAGGAVGSVLGLGQAGAGETAAGRAPAVD